MEEQNAGSDRERLLDRMKSASANREAASFSSLAGQVFGEIEELNENSEDIQASITPCAGTGGCLRRPTQAIDCGKNRIAAAPTG